MSPHPPTDVCGRDHQGAHQTAGVTREWPRPIAAGVEHWASASSGSISGKRMPGVTPEQIQGVESFSSAALFRWQLTAPPSLHWPSPPASPPRGFPASRRYEGTSCAFVPALIRLLVTYPAPFNQRRSVFSPTSPTCRRCGPRRPMCIEKLSYPLEVFPPPPQLPGPAPCLPPGAPPPLPFVPARWF